MSTETQNNVINNVNIYKRVEGGNNYHELKK